MEDILARHRKEQRDLQSQVTQKKKGASKKTRKSVNDECARLERELKIRQEQELAQLSSGDKANGVESGHGQPERDDLLDAILADTTLDEQPRDASVSSPQRNGEVETETDSPQQQRKPNRQKARLARRAAEQEAIAASATREAADMPDLKQQERSRMIESFSQLNLQEKEIAANGHCLYSAIADQMRQLGLNPDLEGESMVLSENASTAVQANDYKTVRAVAARYIAKNSEDFVSFLEEPLDSYLHKVRDTGEWGGQLELTALAQAYGIDINVLQSEGRPEKISSNSAEPRGTAWLAYYRHGFGLGEHYNSLRQKRPTTDTG